MRVFLILVLNLLFLTFNIKTVTAQHFMPGVCGVTAHDMEEMERLHPNDFRGQISQDRNSTVYIPIKFHLVANAEGSGRVAEQQVLKQLCLLNDDYADANMHFYLSGEFSYINHTNIFTAPGSNGNAIQMRKVSNAVNVFITERADTEGSLGTTLGYYSPGGDYIVIRKVDVANLTNTLSHEMGHFFSLRHTFHGWELDPWSESKHGKQVNAQFTISGEAIELVNKSNCQNSADQLCDTPPDYNFGFTSSGCTFNYDVSDRNGEKITPMKENQMGYFNNCSKYAFTPNQNNRMLVNFNSGTRTYIRRNYVPKRDTIRDEVNLIRPTKSQQLNVFDGVLFDWDDVPNATHYVLEIRSAANVDVRVVTTSEFYATNLRKNFNYSWVVTPYNEGYTCSVSYSSTFRTGNESIVNTNETKIFDYLNIYPNPSSTDQIVNIDFATNQNLNIEIKILNLNGDMVSQKNHNAVFGSQSFQLETNNLSKGMYIISIRTDKGTISRKLSIL